MAKKGRVIKMSVNNKPFVSRVVRNGAVQKQFSEKIGKKVGACVQKGMASLKVAYPSGIPKSEIKGLFKACAPQKGAKGKAAMAWTKANSKNKYTKMKAGKLFEDK